MIDGYIRILNRHWTELKSCGDSWPPPMPTWGRGLHGDMWSAFDLVDATCGWYAASRDSGRADGAASGCLCRHARDIAIWHRDMIHVAQRGPGSKPWGVSFLESRMNILKSDPMWTQPKNRWDNKYPARICMKLRYSPYKMAQADIGQNWFGQVNDTKQHRSFSSAPALWNHCCYRFNVVFGRLNPVPGRFNMFSPRFFLSNPMSIIFLRIPPILLGSHSECMPNF